MTTRMDKISENDMAQTSRVNKYKEKYKYSNDSEENIYMTNNISVIEADAENLDIENLKKILDEKYTKKNYNSKIHEEEISEETENLDDTREYDLNKLLEEAHKNKEHNYNEDRFKKLRDTQYDILNSLNLDRIDEPNEEETISIEETNIVNMIETVEESSLNNDNELPETELMSDLISNDDDDECFDDEPENSDEKLSLLEELEKTKQLSKDEIANSEKKNIKQKENNLVSSKIQDEFYTGQYQIKSTDLDDFEDLRNEIKSNNILIKLLIMFIVIILIALGVYFANKYLNLGLF